jgi:type VI protein secretion system component Hcp
MVRTLIRFASLCAAAAGLMACAMPTSPPAAARAPNVEASRAAWTSARELLALDGMTALVMLEGIKGPSTLEGYKDYFAVRMIDLGLASAAGAPKLKPFTFVKSLDATSPLLLRAVSTNRIFKTARLVLLINRGERPIEYASFKFSDVRVTRYDLQTKENSLDEGFALTGARIEMTLTPQSESGLPGKPITTAYDQDRTM